MYLKIVRPLLFRRDPEWIHERTIRAAELIGASPQLCAALAARTRVDDERLAVVVGGLRFANPIGLAAGFDKSGRAVPLTSALGFGHVEIGSISAEPSAGNPKPQLFRIPDDRGIVVNDGFPNDGAARVVARLAPARGGVLLGVNVVNTHRGPGAEPEDEDVVIEDYARSVRLLHERADYLCLNLSSPNTADGRSFFDVPARLTKLLDLLGRIPVRKPLFLKVAPFEDEAQLDAFLAAVDPSPLVTGFAINLPPGKPAQLRTAFERVRAMPGTVSGDPCARVMDAALVALTRRIDRKRYAIIASGGVFTAKDVYRKILLGASLVQLYTALVYEGPGVVPRIVTGLAALLARDGVSSVSDIVGSAVRFNAAEGTRDV